MPGATAQFPVPSLLTNSSPQPASSLIVSSLPLGGTDRGGIRNHRLWKVKVYSSPVIFSLPHAVVSLYRSRALSVAIDPHCVSPLISRSLCVAVELSISLCYRRANDPSPVLIELLRFRFHENANMDQVNTFIENSILTVTVPKAEVKKPNVKPIQITGKPTLPTNFDEVTWAKLKSAICSIFLKQPDSCDLEKLYQSLVGQSPDLVVFLSLVERCWQDLCDQMLIIQSIALYLDRTYVKQTANVRSLRDMGLQLFH
ncbi:hypothetical protein Ahy_B02g059283 [Arachis hypogaea]|uniref:SHSP domain-containing protein n=1 Tax=Arachis hypogaea TaxID=3818 RepID=A0A445AGI6_ARAHY|nr:hypothetical protein Ahy_B02g059283 [Arachis hypogaea]